MRSTTLPTHLALLDPATGAPLRAIGVRKDGRPIWPVLGGAENDGENKSGGDGKGNDDGKAGGDGKSEFAAITSQDEFDRRIAARINREREKFGDYDTLKAAKTELDELKAQNATELEKAVAAARKEGESTATTRSNQKLVASEARALAADAGFHNPRDAAALMDLSKVKVGDDGEVDSAAIKSLIDELATERPYLVKAKDGGSTKKQLKRDPGQGNHSSDGKGDARQDGRAEAQRRYGDRVRSKQG